MAAKMMRISTAALKALVISMITVLSRSKSTMISTMLTQIAFCGVSKVAFRLKKTPDESQTQSQKQR